MCSMEIPWNLTKALLQAEPVHVVMVDTLEENIIEKQVKAAPACDCVVGIGGGQAIDLAKFFAWKLSVRLVTIPTVISVDAFVTAAAAIRRDHKIVYVGATSPDPLVIDYDLIRTAPAELNIAGVGDLLSIHTATYDWEIAERYKHSEFPFSQESVAKARSILKSHILDKECEIKSLSDEGLQTIIDGYIEINTICLPAGHYRVEEGSEHYIFYELESRLQRSFVHGHIVGLGVYLMSKLQNNESDAILTFMNNVGLRYQPKQMELTKADVIHSLKNLQQFIQAQKDLWFTVINVEEITDEWIATAIAKLEFNHD